MPCELTWESEGVVNRFSGFVSGAEFVGSMEAIASDPRFDGIRYIISDRRDMRGHSIGPIEMECAAVIRFGSMPSNPNIRVLVVAPECEMDALNESLSKPPLMGSHPTYAFVDMATARNWLAKMPHLNNPRLLGPRL